MIKDVATEDNIVYFVVENHVNRKMIYKMAGKKAGRAVYRKSDSNNWFEIVRFSSNMLDAYYDVPYYGTIPPNAWIEQR